MKSKQSLKRIVSYAILLLFAIMCILMLLFTTLTLKEQKSIDPDNGFKWMTFNSNLIEGSKTWKIGKYPFGIISIAQLLIGIFAMITVIVNFVKSKDDANKRIFSAGLFSMVLYAVEGIVAKIAVSSEVGSSLSKYISTSAYIPLIIGVVLIVGYYVVRKYVPDDEIEVLADGGSTDSKSARTVSPTISEAEVIDALDKYNDLLEKGIITQEEFDEKKKQLLGL